LPPGIYKIASSVSIAQNVHLAPGAILKPASGVAVTLAGSYTAEPTQHVFDVTLGGSVIVQKTSTIHAAHWGADVSGATAAEVTASIQASLSAMSGSGFSVCELNFTNGAVYPINKVTLDVINRIRINAGSASFFTNDETGAAFTLAATRIEWTGGKFFKSGPGQKTHAIHVINNGTATSVVANFRGIEATDMYRFISAYMTTGGGKRNYRHKFEECHSRTTDPEMQVTGGFGIQLSGDTLGDSAGNDADLINCRLIGHWNNLETNGVQTKMFGGSIDGAANSGIVLDAATHFTSHSVYFEYNKYHYEYRSSPYQPASFGCGYTTGAPTVAFATGTVSGLHLSYGDYNATQRDSLKNFDLETNTDPAVNLISNGTGTCLRLIAKSTGECLEFFDDATKVGVVTDAGVLSIGPKASGHTAIVHGLFRQPTLNAGNAVAEIGYESYLTDPSKSSASFYAVNSGPGPAAINCAQKVGRDGATKASIVASGIIYQMAMGLLEESTDPADPAEGRSVMWQSNGLGTGDDGDIMMKITAGGVTKTATIVDFSAI